MKDMCQLTCQLTCKLTTDYANALDTYRKLTVSLHTAYMLRALYVHS